jgi:exodeoxyribonuclease VII small subunit
MAMFAPAWSDTMPKPNVVPAGRSPLADELARLEEIVRKLEADDVELDTALALFEEGVVRLRAARERLADAELKVQAVLEAAEGDIRLTDLDG